MTENFSSSSNSISLIIKTVQIDLLATKVLRIPEHNIIVIGDLHIGKIEHFRNNGIPLPQNSTSATIEKLHEVLHDYPFDTVIFLGDLFHSIKNESVHNLLTLRRRLSNQSWVLVKGNHDILSIDYYDMCGIEVVESLLVGDILFTHEPLISTHSGLYNISAHVHPAIKLKGKGRQSITLPCYYFGENSALIPAFGYFTGKAIIKPKKGSRVFVITPHGILET